DPGKTATATGDPSKEGEVDALTVTQDRAGSYHGWAVGFYGGGGQPGDQVSLGSSGGSLQHYSVPDARLLQLKPGSSDWTVYQAQDAANDYLSLSAASSTEPVVAAALDGSPFGSAVMASDIGPLVGFDDASGRWRVVPGPVDPNSSETKVLGTVQAVAG